MLTQIAQLGGKSYDQIDHREVNDAYAEFLDRFGFRRAFAQTTDLFSAIWGKAVRLLE